MPGDQESGELLILDRRLRQLRTSYLVYRAGYRMIFAALPSAISNTPTCRGLQRWQSFGIAQTPFIG